MSFSTGPECKPGPCQTRWDYLPQQRASPWAPRATSGPSHTIKGEKNICFHFECKIIHL